MVEQKLSEVEQQLRKAEAAERRRSQAEKAARKAEVCHTLSTVSIGTRKIMPNFFCMCPG